MSGRILKIIGLAATAGGGVFLYDKYVAQQPKDLNLQKAGQIADDSIVHLSGKAKGAEQGARASVFQAKEQIQNAASSLTDAAASLTDSTIKGVDNSADETKSALTQVKGWLSGK